MVLLIFGCKRNLYHDITHPFYRKSDILKSPSQLRGYSVSIYQMHHLDGSLDMPLPNLSICYEVPLDLFDEHFEKQLTPAIMLWYTWRGLNGVLGIHATALENAGMIRIDLGAAYGSDLFNHVMYHIFKSIIINLTD